jgi:hypothetical protein
LAPCTEVPVRDADEVPVIVVHSLEHAVAALGAAAEVGREVTLISAPGAGIYGGAGWFREMIAAARGAAPVARGVSVLDCGDDAGAAQAAICEGVEAVIFAGRPDVAARLADIAGRQCVRLLTERPAVGLDLAALFFASPDRLRRCCIDFLTGD